MSRTEHHGGDQNPTVGHEDTDISVRPVLLSLVGLIVAGAIIQVGVWGLLEFYERRAERDDPPRPPLSVEQGAQPREPRLQGLPWSPSAGWLTPSQDLRTFRRAEEERLNGYGWVDQPAGVVHIPIARAIELLAQRRATATPERPASVATPAGATPEPPAPPGNTPQENRNAPPF